MIGENSVKLAQAILHQDALKDVEEQTKFEVLKWIFLFMVASFILGILASKVSDKSYLISILVPLLAAFLSFDWIVGILNGTMTQGIQKIKRQKEEELDKKYNVEPIIKQQRTEFLAYAFQTNNSLESIFYDPIKEQIEHDDSLKKRLIERYKRSQNCQKAIQELMRFIKKDRDERDIYPIHIIANEASEKIEARDINNLYSQLTLYLRSWLICSIKYDTDELPISWIRNTTSSPEYQLKVIEALRFIKNEYLKQDIVQKLQLSEETITILTEYLGKLIFQLEGN
jgi:hypothetical protein